MSPGIRRLGDAYQHNLMRSSACIAPIKLVNLSFNKHATYVLHLHNWIFSSAQHRPAVGIIGESIFIADIERPLNRVTVIVAGSRCLYL